MQFLAPLGRDEKIDAHHGREPGTKEDSKIEHQG